MRVQIAWGVWWLVLTLAWWLVGGASMLALTPAEEGFVWQLRQHALYLSGVWSVGMMSLVMLLSLRQPWMEKPLGGMDRVYRLHKWAGISAAVAAVLHWGAKESSGWIKTLWGTAGRLGHDPVLAWATELRGTGKDLGEWAFYALLIMVVLTLWQRLLPYRPWRMLHRVMPVLYLMLVMHTLILMPLAFWQFPMGVLMAALLAVGSAAALWSLAGRIGRGRHSYAAQVHAVRRWGQGEGTTLLEVLCALPAHWPGHRPGQFVFVCFEDSEGPHPFTIASAPGGCGTADDGRALLRLLIKPLGDYTRSLGAALQPGQKLRIEGPYGLFDGQCAAQRQPVWVAGGVGITPFFAMLQARQPSAEHVAEGEVPAVDAQEVDLHYCSRNAAADPVVPQLQTLCAHAQPAVRLHVHDAARGQYLQPQDLAQHGAPLDIWFCGPKGLGQMLHRATVRQRGWRMHQEAFQMR